MPHLYTSEIEEQIRRRFIDKIDGLINADRAASYKEVCDNLQISTAQLNNVKSGANMPTHKMLYNLQEVYKISIESIYFINPPKLDLVYIHAQLMNVQQSIGKIEAALI